MAYNNYSNATPNSVTSILKYQGSIGAIKPRYGIISNFPNPNNYNIGDYLVYEGEGNFLLKDGTVVSKGNIIMVVSDKDNQHKWCLLGN